MKFLAQTVNEIFQLQKWKLKLRITKTVTTAFHLYNKKARHELNIAVEGRTLPFFSDLYLFKNKTGQVSYIRSTPRIIE